MSRIFVYLLLLNGLTHLCGLESCAKPKQCCCKLFLNGRLDCRIKTKWNCLRDGQFAKQFIPSKDHNVTIRHLKIIGSFINSSEVTPDIFGIKQLKNVKILTIKGFKNFNVQDNVFQNLENLEQVNFNRLTFVGFDLNNLSTLLQKQTKIQNIRFNNITTDKNFDNLRNDTFQDFMNLKSLELVNFDCLKALEFYFKTRRETFEFALDSPKICGNTLDSSKICGNKTKEEECLSWNQIRLDFLNKTTKDNGLKLRLKNLQFSLQEPYVGDSFRFRTIDLSNVIIMIDKPKWLDFALNILKYLNKVTYIDTLKISTLKLNDVVLNVIEEHENLFNFKENVVKSLQLSNLLSFSNKALVKFCNIGCRKFLNLTSITFTDTDSNEMKYETLNCPKITSLSLTNISLKAIPTPLFNDLQNLKYLDLSRNKFSVVSFEMLRPLKRLQELVITRNAAENGSELTIKDFTTTSFKLKKLDLSESFINTKETELDNFFMTQSDLTEIYLNGTITSTNRKDFNPWFRNNAQLKILSLRNCPKLFSQFSAEQLFKGVSSLEILDLENTGLNGQKKEALENMLKPLNGSLKWLNLHGNNLLKSNLTFLISTKFSKIKYVNASCNNLTSIDESVHANLQNITTLDLRNNMLTFLNGDWFRLYNKNLTELLISGNQFQCDCNLTSFVKWLMGCKWLHDTPAKYNELYRTLCPNYKGSDESILKASKTLVYECEQQRIIRIFEIVATGLGVLLLIIVAAVLIRIFQWRIKYAILKWRIKHGLFKQRLTNWMYEAAVFYDEDEDDWDESYERFLKLEEDMNVRLFLVSRDTLVGDNLVQKMHSSIKKSHYVILMLTQRFLDNAWANYGAMMSEMESFVEKRNKVILMIKDKGITRSSLREQDKTDCLSRLYQLSFPHRVLSINNMSEAAIWAKLGVILLRKERKHKKKNKEILLAETTPLVQ